MNFDPIHWLAVALVGVILLLGGWQWSTSQQLEVCTATHEAYKARAEGDAAIAVLANERALNILSNQVTKLTGELNNAKTDLDKSYAEYDRLRRQPAATRPATAAPLSDAARSLTCDETDKTRFAGKMEQFENGTIARLVKPRDEVILLLNTCLAYVQALPTAPPQ